MRGFRVWEREVRDRRRPIERAEPDLPGWVEPGLRCAVEGLPEAGEPEGQVWLPEEQVRLPEGQVLVQQPLAQRLWFW